MAIPKLWLGALAEDDTSGNLLDPPAAGIGDGVDNTPGEIQRADPRAPVIRHPAVGAVQAPDLRRPLVWTT
jgi:hypothetical protein